MTATEKYKFAGYGAYFKLSIHDKINERQRRNGLNINHIFLTVIGQCAYSKYTAKHPVINNGLYHHSGKNHSEYPQI